MSVTESRRVTYLDGRRLQRLLLGGISRLLRARGHLDRINVFPVADGDTGTNLALTFAAVGERLASAHTRHAGALLTAAADAALDGARGNSGAIFAQYLQGLSEALSGQGRVRPEELAWALTVAEKAARSAIQHPVEGTVLTVMRDIGVAVAPSKLPKDADFITLLSCLLVQAQTTVDTTRQTLAPLRDAGVEDAGARGLLVFLEGMADALQPGLAAARALFSSGECAARVAAASNHLEPPAHRFCTECGISGKSLDRNALKNSLAALGSSVVVVGNLMKLHLHVHVENPEEAFDLARRYGAVSGEKADDLWQQKRSLLVDGRRVALVSDSGADLPAELWDKFGIQMVPLRVNFGSTSYLDKVGLTGERFWVEVARNPIHPKTSQPPPGDFRRAFELLSSHFEHVVVVSVNGKLSGTHQAALSAAKRVSQPAQVTVVDSKNVSVGQGLILLVGAEQARAGKSPAEVVTTLEQARTRTRTYGLLPSLAFAFRGGRVRSPLRWLAQRLPLGFLLQIGSDGSVQVRGILLRNGNRTAALARLIARDRQGRQASQAVRIAIAHSNDPAGGEALRLTCVTLFPVLDSIHVTDLGPAVSVHGGPGTLVIAIQDYAAL